MIKPGLAVLCVYACLAAGRLHAQAPAPTVHASYAGYAHGFNVIDLEATLEVTPGRYRLEIDYTLVGVLGAVLHGDGKTTVTGRFEGLRAEPDELTSNGHFRGDPRLTDIVWRGGNPQVLKLVPPAESERDPVPAADQLHTIDSLSAMAGLIHQVDQEGKCSGHDRTYEGRRLSEINAHSVGEETLEATNRSGFHGVALRCDFEGKQLAGFKRDADQD